MCVCVSLCVWGVEDGDEDIVAGNASQIQTTGRGGGTSLPRRKGSNVFRCGLELPDYLGEPWSHLSAPSIAT